MREPWYLKVLVFVGGLAILAAVVGLLWVAPTFQIVSFGPIVDTASFLSALATLFSAGATLVFAYVVNYLFLLRSSSHKADSDLMLQVVKDVRGALDSLQSASLACYSGKRLTPDEEVSLIFSERAFSHAVHSLGKATGFCKMERPEEYTHGLKRLRSALKDSLTDSPFPGPYPPAARSRIATHFRDVRDELTRISFLIIHR